MEIIFEDFIYSRVCEYLSINDNKKLSLVNKKVNKNILNKKIRKFYILKKSTVIITNLMKNYLFKIKILNLYYINGLIPILKRINALMFYRYYEKEYINGWYNIQIPWKKNLIDKYKKKLTTTPSRLDLYLLIKDMDIIETSSIGW